MCPSTAGKEERPRRSRWNRAYVCIPLDCLRVFFVIKISTLWDVALVVSGPDWFYWRQPMSVCPQQERSRYWRFSMGSKVAVLAGKCRSTFRVANSFRGNFLRLQKHWVGEWAFRIKVQVLFGKKQRTQTATFQVNLTSVGCYVRLASLICNWHLTAGLLFRYRQRLSWVVQHPLRVVIHGTLESALWKKKMVTFSKSW